MWRTVRYTLRFTMIAALVAALPLLFSPASPAHTPYISALSALSATPALAATHCADRACNGFGGPCIKAAGYRCFAGAGQCFTRGC